MKRSFVSPLFAWTDAVLRGSWSMLDSMEEAARQGRGARIGVIPTADAPPRRPRRKAAASAKPRVKARKRRR